MKNTQKKELYAVLLILLIVGISLGYAALSANLSINGSSQIKGNTWDIHFANLQVTNGSVSIGTGDQAASITANDTTEITYTITLDKPGDFYEFEVDAVNSGSIDGMISSIASKYNGVTISSTNPLPNYLIYSVTYSDDVELAVNQLLKAGTSETYKVRIEFKEDIENSELPASDQSLSFAFEVTYLQADNNGVEVIHPSFATDSWETIVDNVSNGSIPSYYHIGDEKEVDLGSLGVNSLRIINMSIPNECKSADYSQTACGFVLEFTSLIGVGTESMNPQNVPVVGNGLGNEGGWRDCHMRNYLNTTVYNALPSIIKNNVKEVTVYSGYSWASQDTENFITSDYLYLLSTKEVYGDNVEDSASAYTRRMDYYNTTECTTSSCLIGRKRYNTNSFLSSFLRTPPYWEGLYSNQNFFTVNYEVGKLLHDTAWQRYGSAPAFRLF